MSRADSQELKRPLAGLFSLWVKGRKWESPAPGNSPRVVYPCRGSVALKFRFCRDADKCFDLINKTRQARNGARPCANGAVASIRLSRFIARRDRPVRAGCSAYSVMCVSPAMSEALSWMVGGLLHRRIFRQMRRFTPQRAWFHRTYLHRRPHQMRRSFSILQKRRRRGRSVPGPLPLRPSSEWTPPIPPVWFSH